MRKSKSNGRLGGNLNISQNGNGHHPKNSRKSLFESNIHNNQYEEHKFHTKKNSLKQNVGPIHMSEYRSSHRRKDSFNSIQVNQSQQYSV